MVSTAAHDPALLTGPAPVAAPAPTHLQVVPPLEDETTQQEEREFASFGKAILLGILIGIPVLALIVAGAVKLMWPATETVAVFGIALWVSLFCGPFLAGTVTVGLWAGRQH